MATFREIDERLLALVDEETGELLDVEAFEALQMERTQKAENLAKWALDLQEEQELIKGEIRRLRARQEAAERKEKQLRDFLPVILKGEKLKTPTISVSYRASSAVEIEDEDALITWAQRAPEGEDCLRYKRPEVNKSEVKQLLQEGVLVPGASLVDRVSTVIR